MFDQRTNRVEGFSPVEFTIDCDDKNKSISLWKTITHPPNTQTHLFVRKLPATRDDLHFHALINMQASDPDSLSWWQKTIIYQIYPRSLQDSSGNGVGDLPGIISRLDYFVDLGVETLWLSPFYPSPQIDFGYDVSNYCDVDPIYGSMADFDRLVQEAHKRGLKIVVDFVGGHSSYLHPWFEKSVKREDPYTDYYVWHDGKLDEQGNTVPPNNWISVFKGSSWKWHPERKQFYYRPFLPEQPKLNYRCPQLVEDIKNCLRFWFDHGVDGMRLDAINEIVETADKTLDEPIVPGATCPKDEYEYLDHVHTTMQPETFEVMRQWADVMAEYIQKDGRPRFMIGETFWETEKRNRYRESGIVPSNMDLLDKLDHCELSGNNVKDIVDAEYRHLPPNEWPTFVIGNHDRHRVSHRFGPEYCDALNMLLLTLKGTPTTYYGEELGMTNIHVTYEETQDPFGKNVGPDRYQLMSRDPVRSPMQWDASTNAGFSSADRTWLPVHPEYATCNVKCQSDAGGMTHLKLYVTLGHLRKDPAFTYGSLEYALTNKEIFSFIREDKPSTSRYLVVINFGKIRFAATDKALSGHPVVKASHGEVKASSCKVAKTLTIGHRVALDDIELSSGDCVVLRLE